MKTLANWGFGNCISVNTISNLDIVVDEILRIGMETPKIEVSLTWKGVKESSLQR